MFRHGGTWVSRSEVGSCRASPAHFSVNRFSLLGDVVQYPDAPSRTVQVWDGLGDWNVSWPAWHAGGLLR
jgi:hypothetical protein